MISIKTHGIVDYSLGAIFLASPYLFGFSNVYFAHDVFTVLGLAIPGYSLLTDYRPAISRAVPLSMHMTFDVASGVFVVLAPWIYGYHELLTPFQGALHWILGLATISLVAFTGREEPPVAAVYKTEEPTAEPLPGKKAA